jgi:cytochrome c-type biogenesis protein
VQNYRQEMGLSFPLLMDEGETIRKAYGIVSFPSTFVLNRDGEIIARHFGALTAEGIEQLVSEALAA